MNLSLTAPGAHAVVRILRRHLLISVPVCTAIALFLHGAFGEPLLRAFVFSFSIGLSCQVFIDAGRHLVSRWLMRRRPTDDSLVTGWPGWGWTSAIVVLGILAGIQAGYVIAGALLGLEVSPPDLRHVRGLILTLTISLVAAFGVTGTMWARARLASEQARAQAAQRAAAENQLKLLESQLEPHMLFNTLANLRVLIALDPPRAQAMLDRLIAFLRATLTASRVGTHSLAAEFDRLADYLALMQVRMGPRLAFVFDLPAALRDTPVPPLLLQPLVENCITHGLEPQVAGGRIHIAAARDGATLVLTVRDSGVGLDAAGAKPGTRFGLTQVRERLAALYGDGARFTLGPGADGAGTEARIVIPLTPPP